jgi:hypothetical protein
LIYPIYITSLAVIEGGQISCLKLIQKNILKFKVFYNFIKNYYMEFEKLILEVTSTKPKPGFSERLIKIREIAEINGNAINLESVDFGNHEDHSNHSDWDNRTRKPGTSSGKLLKLKTVTLKAVSEICAHTDHGDHNDFTDSYQP